MAFRSLTEQKAPPRGVPLQCVWGVGTVRTRLDPRTHSGRSRGGPAPRDTWGRPRAIRPEQLDAIGAALQAGTSKAAVCRTFGVKRTTLYDALARVDASIVPSVEDRL